jgi:hypothetical protein
MLLSKKSSLNFCVVSVTIVLITLLQKLLQLNYKVAYNEKGLALWLHFITSSWEQKLN